MNTIKEKLIQSLNREIAEIKAFQERELSLVKEKVTREKLVPYNQELDKARAEAEKELSEQLNCQIATLQTQFQKKKQEMFEAGEKKKAEYAENTINLETYAITSECGKAIAKLTSQIQELEE